jgi:hypothetical protein
VIRNDCIGDMQVVTPQFIQYFSNVGYKVYVFSRKSCLDIFSYNPYVTGCFVYSDKGLINYIKIIIKQEVDKLLVTDVIKFQSLLILDIIF